MASADPAAPGCSAATPEAGSSRNCTEPAASADAGRQPEAGNQSWLKPALMSCRPSQAARPWAAALSAKRSLALDEPGPSGTSGRLAPRLVAALPSSSGASGSARLRRKS